MTKEALMARAVLHSRSMQRRPSLRADQARERGFTLVELGAVVVIVGILAVIAIVGYRKYILSSKLSEAQNVIGAIKLAQEDFKAERGTYFGAAFGGAAWCPWDGTTITGKKNQWNSACWAALPVHVEQPVQFGYWTDGGITPTQAFNAPPDTGGLVTAWTPPAAAPWYSIEARADLSPGGPFTILATSSGTNQIFVFNEGD